MEGEGLGAKGGGEEGERRGPAEEGEEEGPVGLGKEEGVGGGLRRVGGGEGVEGAPVPEEGEGLLREEVVVRSSAGVEGTGGGLAMGTQPCHRTKAEASREAE